MISKERAKALRSTPEAKARTAECRRKRNAKRTPEEVAEVNRKARAWAAKQPKRVLTVEQNERYKAKAKERYKAKAKERSATLAIEVRRKAKAAEVRRIRDAKRTPEQVAEVRRKARLSYAKRPKRARTIEQKERAKVARRKRDAGD